MKEHVESEEIRFRVLPIVDQYLLFIQTFFLQIDAITEVPFRLSYRYKIDSKREDHFSAKKLATDEIVWYTIF